MVMADEGNERGAGRMDLNLYLGRPRSPRPRTSDLGSDLALSSLPLSPSSTTEESRAPLEMSSALELEPSDSHAPYSPSHTSFAPEPSIQPVNDNPTQEYTPYTPSYEPYDPTTTLMRQSNGPNGLESPVLILQETEEPVENNVPCPPSYTPSYVTESPSYIPLETQETNDALLRPYIPSMYAPPMPSYVNRSPSYSPPLPDELSSRRDIFENPELRLRRLIESSHRLRLRRFRTSLPYHGIERLPASPVSDRQLMRDIMSSQRSLETNGIAAESSEEKEDKKKSAANFECNICLDTSEEPVVTSCGHLFCWPCLYQWLNVHSEHKECPVCKGEVTEANITPIYGRGSSEASEGKTLAENGESNIKIPPRPRGNRFESLRQQFRPTSWRRLVNQQMRGRNRFEGMLDAGHHPVLTMLRARRLLRDGPENTPTPQSSNTNLPFDDEIDLWQQSILPQSTDTHSIFRDGIDFWHRPRDNTTAMPRISETDRAELWHRASMYGPASAADQASGSSTTAVIRGDAGIPEGFVEPNSAGSSRSRRRRGRSSAASSSLDVDGGILHASKRRRLN